MWHVVLSVGCVACELAICGYDADVWLVAHVLVSVECVARCAGMCYELCVACELAMCGCACDVWRACVWLCVGAYVMCVACVVRHVSVALPVLCG